ncbi:MAG: hypothetical protein ACD_84C00038G0002 [uncultured bacterium]|nr:MAG: hypothetical protein ACD_84C00038G0002 [uncultured bacterium]
MHSVFVKLEAPYFGHYSHAVLHSDQDVIVLYKTENDKKPYMEQYARYLATVAAGKFLTRAEYEEILNNGKRIVTKAEGTFKNSKDFADFLNMFQAIELAKPHHHRKPSELIVLDRGVQFTMFINSHADFLVRASLKDGMLKKWSKLFEISTIEV